MFSRLRATKAAFCRFLATGAIAAGPITTAAITTAAITTAAITTTAIVTGAAAARAADVNYEVRVHDLKLTEGKLPAPDNASVNWRIGQILQQSFQPYVVLDGDGEAYLGSFNAVAGPIVWSRIDDNRLFLAVRVPQARKVAGSLFWPKPDATGMVKLRFEIEAQPEADVAAVKTRFAEAKGAHYAALTNRNIAGGAWFRRQSRLASKSGSASPTNEAPALRNRNRVDHLGATFDLFGGGQAVSENLQLDRALRRIVPGEEVVPLEKIRGIDVAEIDWKPLLQKIDAAGEAAKSDALAKLVPADQHVAFFPSFNAFVQVADRLAEQGTIILHIAEARSKDSQLAARYERQLGLSIDGMGRIVGPKVIRGVAITGSDPYFQSGTDVALVFETAQPEILKNLLLAQIAIRAQQTPGAKSIAGEAGGLAYSGMRSDDRAVSSYVSVLAGAVLLTNSPYQVERFAAVANKQAPAIASLDEFTFFRNRYPLGDKQESALVFLSDATIRRWCGPRWRIGASRELRDGAVLAELQAEYMDRIVKQQIETGPLHTDLPLTTGDALKLAPNGPRSTTLGDLAFMTPIAELKFDQVSRSEADAYDIWRDNYQRNWRWAFDPIALRLSVEGNRLAADLSVMPLIAGTEYRQFIAVSRGAAISPDAGDRHDALVQAIMAINVKNEMFRSAGAWLPLQAPGGVRIDPFGWVGQSISISVDRDPFWEELAKCDTDNARQSLVMANFGRLPIGVMIEAANGFKLTAFLAGLRAYIDQTSPDMMKWEPQEYRGEPYVKITPSSRAAVWRDADGGDHGPRLHYVANGKYLFVTPSEAMLKRFLDRQLALRPVEKGDAAKAAPAEVVPTEAAQPKTQPQPQPWLGSSLALQVDHMMLPLLSVVFGNEYQAWMQSQSWNNLPILNEWRRLYPDQDPVELHARVWHETLVCPGGGKYVWNEQWQTMESTVYGHPGEPKTGPNTPAGLNDFRFGNFGVTFEEQGLRARVTLERKAREKAPEKNAAKKPENAKAAATTKEAPIAMVLKTPILLSDLHIDESDKSALRDYRAIAAPILLSLEAKYIKEHQLEATAREIKDLRDSMMKDDDSSEKDLTPEDSQGIDELAKYMVEQWKFNRALFKKYGGRVVFQQAGIEPLDAYRDWLREQETAGAYEIFDPKWKEAFGEYYKPKYHHFIDEPNAFKDPPWQAEQKPAGTAK